MIHGKELSTSPDLLMLYSVAIVLKHVASGDYQQTKGIRSEKTIPTGKLFGLRKYDRVSTRKGQGFVQGKRSSGYFALMDIRGQKISASVTVKKDCYRQASRSTTLLEQRVSTSGAR